MSDITLITAFYDLGRDQWASFPRNTKQYLDSFEVFLRYDYDMIIFIDDRYYDYLQERLTVSGSPNKRLIPINRDWMTSNLWTWTRYECEKELMASDYYRSLLPGRIAMNYPENVNPDYTIMTHSKIDFVNHAIEKYETSDFVAWVDFGYFHNKSTPDVLPQGPFNHEKLNKERINICLVNPITEEDRDILFTLINAPEKIAAYFFAATKDNMGLFQEWCHHWLMKYQDDLKICDDEQGLWLQIYFQAPEIFELHTFGRWHQAMRYFTE